MNRHKFRNYYYVCLGLMLIASIYPLYMGFKVLIDYLQFGHVLGKNYHKYLIPYTPISLALITGTALLPLSLKQKKWGQLTLTSLCVAIFFAFEFLLEKLVIVQVDLSTTLESWQMYMCYVPYNPNQTTAIDILLGDYSPTFKLHFYMIAVILVITAVNCLYGFGKLIRTGDRSRQKPLLLQSIATVLFLGLCILACFTAFFRTGTILISPLSAMLMALFFIILGTTAGMFTLSFLFKHSQHWAFIPAAVSGGLTLAMYIGEMFLLSNHLYRFGYGWFFSPLGSLVLAPVDVLIILGSFALTFIISFIALPKKHL